ncbi:phosphoribosylaminoimidazole-succinocarboxamide synthase [Tepiditoga spiralis]|uniref:Phosphoribosylaminoimidazole-succinocarboxamide synthase n=1 Tax=Tepiditoga spiralis TaxID=2108365 RepID=A0A7G1G422_9BACT|nr:phosphoribosylaminoimidazolesuccinocarboxamide synthase [Tepiditoga spiralis]BBE31218.1 phosphoribosylaminoimidazole-succinocarboxamide synthase [Tepiditoga spiralis]
MNVNELKFIYEGKAKKLFEYENNVLIYYKDDVTAFNGEKKDNLIGKGKINKKISVFMFELMEKNNVKTHFIKDIDETTFLAKKVEIMPLEVIVRNYTAGSFCKRYGIEKGKKLKMPLVEFSLKNDDLGDPMISDDAIIALDICSKKDLEHIKNEALKINNILNNYFKQFDILLVDFKVEFGKNNNEILLADEISPDTCRFWDKNTMESLDKDVYREGKGDLVDTYTALIRRINL